MSDSRAASGAGCFRLPLHLKQYGAVGHRSGWPYVVEHLKAFHHPDGILLDDFIERTFQRGSVPEGWQEPWIGIFHHPPNLPEWLDPSAPIQAIMARPEFQASLPNLKGAIALSEYLGAWLRTVLRCPVMVRKLPTEPPIFSFSIDRWEAQDARRIVQIGWYARNHRAIHQAEVPDGFRKIHLRQDQPWITRAIERTDKFSPYLDRPWVGEVDLVHELKSSQFDYLLSSSVILNEYWDVSASNTVVEAMVRGTPILINRLPALEEYLGKDYPLFYDDLRDVRALLQDPSRVRLAHRYLLKIDRGRMFDVNRFAQDVMGFVNEILQNRD